MTANRILLTGFMGSGKTTVGPLIADQLGFRFIDLDEQVEKAAGRSAAALFLERGESIFRALETAVLTQALAEEDVVIATGGGALTSEATLALAKDGGVVVYLRVALDTLAERLEPDEQRPMLKDDDGRVLRGARLLDRIESILKGRQPYYEQADIIIDAEDKAPADVAAAVVEAIRGQRVERFSEPN
jgi:shikimate kinase